MALLAFTGFGFAACTSPPKSFPAQGDFVGLWVETEVDSPLAAEYLAQSYSSPKTEQEVKGLLLEFEAKPLSSRSLKELSRRASVDFATLYFARRSLQNPDAQEAQDLFFTQLAKIKKRGPLDSSIKSKIDAKLGTWKILFVPGFHYKKEPHTGADFAHIRSFFRRLGLETELIEILEDGRIDSNAQIIAEALRQQPLNQPLVVVSTSKGGPETLEALHALSTSEDPKDQRTVQQIVAWVSLGGLLRGTPLSDTAFAWPYRPLVQLAMNLQGTRTRGLVDLRTRPRTRRLNEMNLSQLPLSIHFVAAPLLGQVSPQAKGRHLRLRRRGPNDGLTLLADSILADSISPSSATPHSRLIFTPGLDHFYLSPDIHLQALALALTLPSLQH